MSNNNDLSSRADEDDTVGTHERRQPLDEGAVAERLSVLTQRNADLEASLRRVEREASDLAERMALVTKEAVAQRKRLERANADAVKHANEALIVALAPVLDDLSRALSTLSTSLAPEVRGYTDGVRLVEDRLLSVLSQFGVTVFSTLGEPFDAKRAEAFALRRDDAVAPGTVVEEMRRGLSLHERLIRPALVVVSELGEPRDENRPTRSSA